MTKPDLVYILETPEGRKQAHDLDSDKSGESNSSDDRGHHAFAPEHNAVAEDAGHFATEVAADLDGMRK